MRVEGNITDTKFALVIALEGSGVLEFPLGGKVAKALKPEEGDRFWIDIRKRRGLKCRCLKAF